jgi:hypothetical protein
MTRVDAAAFVEALTVESSQELRETIEEFEDALWKTTLQALDETRCTARSLRLNAARERLIDRLCGDAGTQPTPRPL